MRQLSLIIAFITIICFHLEAQTVSGIGFIRIGLTTKFIDSLKSVGYSYKTATDGRMPLKNQIVEYVEDPMALAPSGIIPGYRKFNVTGLKVSDIDLNVVTFEFYNDTLFKFKIGDDDPRFKNVLSIKYKTIRKSSQSKTIVCENGFGATYNHEEINSLDVYRDDKLYADYFEYFFYSENCELLRANGFEMYNKATVKKVNGLTTALKIKEAKEVIENEKNKHKDF